MPRHFAATRARLADVEFTKLVPPSGGACCSKAPLDLHDQGGMPDAPTASPHAVRAEVRHRADGY